LGLASLTSWWVLVVATLVSFLLYQASLRRHDATAGQKWRRELGRRLAYYPFADRDEWLAHERLLDTYGLPPYEARAFDAPAQERAWPAFLAVPVRAACSLFLAGMLACMYVTSVMIWPLWLVLMSLCRRKPVRKAV